MKLWGLRGNYCLQNVICQLSVANTEGVGSKLFQNKWNIVLYKAQKKLNFFYFDVSNQCGDKSIMNGVDWVVDRLWILLHHLWNKVLHFWAIFIHFPTLIMWEQPFQIFSSTVLIWSSFGSSLWYFGPKMSPLFSAFNSTNLSYSALFFFFLHPYFITMSIFHLCLQNLSSPTFLLDASNQQGKGTDLITHSDTAS